MSTDRDHLKRYEDSVPPNFVIPRSNTAADKRNKTIHQYYEESKKRDYEQAIESPLLTPERTLTFKNKRRSKD